MEFFEIYTKYVNDVMHIKFGQAGLGSSWVIALELFYNPYN